MTSIILFTLSLLIRHLYQIMSLMIMNTVANITDRKCPLLKLVEIIFK